MARLLRPTDAELAILRVLWSQGPSSVRQVHDVITAGRPLGYTTTLKMLQVMTEKGLVVREEQGRQHIYRARHAEADTQRKLVGDLVQRAFGGSAAKLVLQALSTHRTTPAELKEIQRLIAAQKRDKETDHG